MDSNGTDEVREVTFDQTGRLAVAGNYQPTQLLIYQIGSYFAKRCRQSRLYALAFG
jgi:hypothetical protein